MHYRQIPYEVTLISSDHYKNSSVIVDLAMGQIPRSTERISSLFILPRSIPVPINPVLNATHLHSHLYLIFSSQIPVRSHEHSRIS